MILLPRSEWRFVQGAILALTVLVVLSLAAIGLCLWDIRMLRDQMDRMPRAEIHGGVHLSGSFPDVRYYEAPKGYDVTPEPIDTTPPAKSNNKKGVSK
jgi:hypothetical protein